MSNQFKDILLYYSSPDFEKRLKDLRNSIINAARFEPGSSEALTVTNIIRDVFEKGDKAVSDYTSKFDNVTLNPEEFEVSADELVKAHRQIDAELLDSIKKSISNVRKYQSEIFVGDKNTHPGVKYTPLKSAGLCIPGASAPLPSTVIMTAVPAQVAGVEEIAVISPPRYSGSINPVILAVCHEIGINKVYRIGGVQAVAALAYGTETISKVDKIVGPGNQWVQMAKKEVFGIVDIDSIAGPSEVLVIADSQSNPAWVVADMLSQAEHDPGSAVIFTDSVELANDILIELEKQTALLDRSEGTTNCLKKYSGIVVFENMDQVVNYANEFATEHLQIQCGPNSRNIADMIYNAGAIFIGPYTPVAVGDYWAGPSHTLPTGMSARFFSPLSSNDFIKSSSIIEYSKDQLAKDSQDIIRLAMTEGLDAHAKSVQIRQQ